MCFTSPRSTSRSMACQVSSKGGSTPPDSVPFSFPEATGQCMRYRSRYDVRSRASDARHACSTSSGACASFHSLEVTNTSRRLSLVFKNTSAIPSPTSCSFSYTDAQSTCVYPARNAASTASRAAPGSTLFHVPRPTSGTDAPVGFSEPSGWCGRRVTSGRSSLALRSSSSRSLEARATSVSRLICSHRARSLARRTAGPPVTSKKSTRPRPLGETWSGRDRNASIRASPCRWRVAASFSSCGAHTRLQSRLQPASRWNASGGGSAAKTASRSSGVFSEPAGADIPSRGGEGAGGAGGGRRGAVGERRAFREREGRAARSATRERGVTASFRRLRDARLEKHERRDSRGTATLRSDETTDNRKVQKKTLRLVVYRRRFDPRSRVSLTSPAWVPGRTPPAPSVRARARASRTRRLASYPPA